MGKILIAYATNSGGTLTASEFIQESLKTKNFEVALKDIRGVKKDTLTEYDLVIFGSPSWNYDNKEGQPHEFFTKFMTENNELALKKVAVFGLGDTAYLRFCGAVDIILDFAKKNGAEIIAEPLRVDGFFFSQKENEDLIEKWIEFLTRNISSKTTQAY